MTPFKDHAAEGRPANEPILAAVGMVPPTRLSQTPFVGKPSHPCGHQQPVQSLCPVAVDLFPPCVCANVQEQARLQSGSELCSAAIRGLVLVARNRLHGRVLQMRQGRVTWILVRPV